MKYQTPATSNDCASTNAARSVVPTGPAVKPPGGGTASTVGSSGAGGVASSASSPPSSSATRYARAIQPGRPR
ncbi:MAG: hypothetical protein F4Z60_10925 [Chloroflexi bacterium]|nr:hypothetical protein [Chloroflexota bacterium]